MEKVAKDNNKKQDSASPGPILRDFENISMSDTDLMSFSFSDALFINVLSTYPVEAHIECKCQLSAKSTFSEGDWIGLFKVGWEKPKQDFLAKADMKVEKDGLFAAFFMGSQLPTDSTEFYQFCYVNAKGLVKGASTPFRFKSNQSDDFVAEVDDDDEDALVVSSKSMALENELAHMKLEHRTLKAHTEEVSRTLVNRTQELERELETTKAKLAGLKNSSQKMCTEHEKLRCGMAVMESRLTEQKENTSLLEKAHRATQARLIDKERENQELMERIRLLDIELVHTKNQLDASREAIKMHSQEHKKLIVKQEEDNTLVTYLKRHVEESASQLKEVTDHETLLADQLRSVQQQMAEAEEAFRCEQEALNRCRAELGKVLQEKQELEVIIATLREQLGRQPEPDQLKLLHARHQSLETAYGAIRQQYLVAEEREHKYKVRYNDMAKINKTFLEREEKLHTRVLDLERRLRQGAEEYRRLLRRFKEVRRGGDSAVAHEDHEEFHDAESEIFYPPSSVDLMLMDQPAAAKSATQSPFTCFVCSKVLSSQQDYEKHVHEHFSDEA